MGVLSFCDVFRDVVEFERISGRVLGDSDGKEKL